MATNAASCSAPVPACGGAVAANGLLTRLLGRHAAILFVRNTIVSCFAFAIDLLLLWLLVQYAGAPRLAAATLAFMVAVSIHYLLCRAWVFCDSTRGLGAGYLYFIANAGIGLAATLALFATLVELTGIHYLIARVIASVFAGVVVFLLNATLNFKSL